MKSYFLTFMELRRARFYLVSIGAILIIAVIVLRVGDLGEWGPKSLVSIFSKIEAGKGFTGDDNEVMRYAIGGLLQIIVCLLFVVSGLVLIVTYMMRNRLEVDNGQFFLSLTSPHSYLFLHLHKFVFCFLLCTAYSTILVFLLYCFLPDSITDIAGIGNFLILYSGYAILAVLLPLLALLYLLANVNLAYQTTSRLLILSQYLGVYALVVYVIPEWLLPLFAKWSWWSLTLPTLEFNDGFVLASELPIEPLIVAGLLSSLFIYLATRVWQELEV